MKSCKWCDAHDPQNSKKDKIMKESDQKSSKDDDKSSVKNYCIHHNTATDPLSALNILPSHLRDMFLAAHFLRGECLFNICNSDIEDTLMTN